MLKLSFIVPFYGVEKYIGQCLDSLCEQDIDNSEYEIICINDCSLDKSVDIVRQYQTQYSNIRLIEHKKNKKLGFARNTGLNVARGKYVWFIDSDDYIEKNCLKEILEICEANNLEILHFSIRDNYGLSMRQLIETQVVTGPEEELISYRQSSIEITYPWNRIYLREFLINNNLYFNKLYGGDVIHSILAVNLCQRMMNINKYYHYYRVDNFSSDTKSQQTPNKIYNMTYVLAKAIYDIVPYINNSWKWLIIEAYKWRVNFSWRTILKLSNVELNELYCLVKQSNDLYNFVLMHSNAINKIILKCPYFTKYILRPLYKLLYGLKMIKWFRMNKL